MYKRDSDSATFKDLLTKTWTPFGDSQYMGVVCGFDKKSYHQFKIVDNGVGFTFFSQFDAETGEFRRSFSVNERSIIESIQEFVPRSFPQSDFFHESCKTVGRMRN